MSFDTYSNLLAEVADELSRSDLTAKIPGWVTLAQSYIARKIDLLEGQQVFVDNLVPSQAYLDMPAGFKSPIHFEIQGNPLRILNQVSLDKRSDVLQNSSDTRPICFAMVGKKAYFAPVPQSNEEIHIFYNGYPPPLVATTNETNQLLEDAPDALYYSTLLYSAPYLGDDERLATWVSMRNDAIESLKLQYWNNSFGGGPVATRPDRIPRDSHR